MQYIDDTGCLTQRSQLDRLQELADRITRERVKALQPSDLLSTTGIGIGASSEESTWDLDHLALARSASHAAVQLLLAPEAGLDNLGPTPAITRLLRATGAPRLPPLAPARASRPP